MTSRKKKTRAQYLTIGAFLVMATGILVGLFYIAVPYGPRADVTLDDLEKLPQVFQAEGIDAYLQKKRVLKTSVAEQLSKDEATEEGLKANRIAVYLFPEILQRNDFEQSTAQERWAPMEKEIEKAPRTSASRQLFEQLRANIWNYESPSEPVPRISEDAQKVIRLYDVMSTP